MWLQKWKNRWKKAKIIDRVIIGMVAIAACTMIISVSMTYINENMITKMFLSFIDSLNTEVEQQTTATVYDITANMTETYLKKESNQFGNWLMETRQKLVYVRDYLETYYANIENLDETYQIDQNMIAKDNASHIGYARPDCIQSIDPEQLKKESIIFHNIYEMLLYFNYEENISNVTITLADGYSIIYSENYYDYTKTDFRKEKWYQDAMKEENDYQWMSLYQNTAGENCITCISRLYDKNTQEIIGASKIDLDFDDFIDVFQRTKAYDDDIELVIKDSGKLVCDPNLLNNVQMTEEEIYEIVQIILQNKGTGKGRSKIQLRNGNQYIFYIEPVGQNINWNLCKGINDGIVDNYIRNFNEIVDKNVSDDMERLESVYRNVFHSFLHLSAFLGACTFIMAVLLSVHITRPLKNLADEANKIADGDLTHRLVVEGDDEVSQLGHVINHMLNQIKIYIADMNKMVKETERINTELEIAAHIQGNMLPDNYFDTDRLEIATYMMPAKEVGGDFYDFFCIDETHVCFVVADVSGKGVPAALFMAIGKTLIREHIMRERNLEKVFYDVNNLLCDVNKDGNFITAFAAVVDLDTGKMEYVNAGHEKPLIKRPDGEYEIINLNANFVLAAMEDMEYRAESMILERGSVVFEYTDGIPEANNAAGELYGMTRLVQSMNAHKKFTGKELIEKVIQDMNEYVNGTDQFDDTTIITFWYK